MDELTACICCVQLRARSEDDADDELEAVVVLKHGKKVVCGTQSGVLNIFSWGQFADCSDRCPGGLSPSLHYLRTHSHCWMAGHLMAFSASCRSAVLQWGLGRGRVLRHLRR